MSDTWTDTRENLGQDPTFDTDTDWDFVPVEIEDTAEIESL